jgi:hypothetical protein
MESGKTVMAWGRYMKYSILSRCIKGKDGMPLAELRLLHGTKSRF